METKPYRIQSPEDIAKDYGGNKQKIAQAMQMGVVDPTAGVLAGMFIDRMRSAQAQEMAPQSSVAQQVMAPPPPPGAPPMGGMPPGAPPSGAPPMGAPPMGAPPMGGMPPGAPPMGDMAPPMGDMPPGAPPMGMADGGLAALPISDYMFDEPDNGGYAGGGIVAFADAGEARAQPAGLTSTPDYSVLRQMMADYGNEGKGREQYESYYQPKREAAERLRQFYGGAMSEEGQKKRRDEDKNLALMQLGSSLMSTTAPGGLLGGIGASINKVLPSFQEAAKERRAEQRDALKQLAADEGMTNAEQREFAKYMLGRTDKRADLAQNIAQFTSADARAQAGLESAERTSAADNAARIEAALIAAKDKSDMTPTYGQAGDIYAKSAQFLDKALEAMAAAETKGDLPGFQAARNQYRSAFNNLTKSAAVLRLAPPVSASMSSFPKMGQRIVDEKKPARGSGTSGSSNLYSQADKIIGGVD